VELDVAAVVEDDFKGMAAGHDDVVDRDVLYDAVLGAKIGLSKPMVRFTRG
jgi:hypothetical protein